MKHILRIKTYIDSYSTWKLIQQYYKYSEFLCFITFFCYNLFGLVSLFFSLILPYLYTFFTIFVLIFILIKYYNFKHTVWINYAYKENMQVHSIFVFCIYIIFFSKREKKSSCVKLWFFFLCNILNKYFFFNEM